MASPATAAFLTAWRKENPQPALMVQVQLTDPSTKTLKLTDRAHLYDPNGDYWEPLIHDADPIEAPGSYLSTGPDIGGFSFTIKGDRFAYQASTDVLSKALTTYRWQGAVVTVWFWELSLTALSDRLQVFKGEIVDVMPGLQSIVVVVGQRMDWNGVVTPDYVTRGRFPRAPEKSLGLPLPIIMGFGDARPMRGDWAGAMGTSRNRFDRGGGAIPTCQGVLVDVGRGASGEKAKVLFAGHELEKIGDPANGCNLFMRSNGEQPTVIEPAGGDIINIVGGDEAGFYVPDNSAVAYYIMTPSEVLVPANPASEPRYVLDPGNEVTYALLDYDAGKRNLHIPLQTIEPPGEYIDSTLVMGYRTVGGATNLKLTFRNNVLASERNDAVGASTTPTTMLGGSIVGHEPTTPWGFSDCEARVEFVGVGTGVKCHVFFIALIINFKPRQELVGVGRFTQRVEYRGPKTPRFITNRRVKTAPAAPPSSPIHEVEVERPITELDGEFYGNVNGQPDDGGGTYGGFPNDTIDGPSNIARYLLETYLGQSSSTVEVAASTHGSFVDARAKLKTWNQLDMSYFLQIAAPKNGEDILTDLARDSLSWVFINRFTDKFAWHVWKKGAAVDYDYTITPDDVIERNYLEISRMPKSRILTAIRTSYLWDAYRRAFASDAWASPDGSRAGYKYLGIRDQYMSVVTGENDNINWKAGIPITSTLAAGDYTDATLITEVRSKMAASVASISVGCGARIVAGVNDKLDFNDGSARSVTLTAALYATMEDLAAHVTTKMNSVSTNWTCSYSRATRKFTISRSAGTAQLKFAGLALSCAATLGFYVADYTAGSPYVSDREAEEERFTISIPGSPAELNWETGANGVNGTNTCAAELLGYDMLRDLTGANGYTAICPKNNREQTLKAARDKYRGRREMTFDARTIITTDTIRELIARFVDLLSWAPVVVTFRSTKVPDLERARVIQFSSLFDTIYPFPREGTDGSWAGKKFWVCPVRQKSVGQWDTEVTCVEVAAA